MEPECKDARRRPERLRLMLGLLVALIACLAGVPSSALAAGQVLVYTGNAGIDQTFVNFAASAGRTLASAAVMPADLSNNACVLLPANGVQFDPGQLAELKTYVMGGGTVIAMAENGRFPGGPPGTVTMNNLASNLGAFIGGAVGGQIDEGPHTTTRIAPSKYTAGVGILSYAYTTSVSVSGPASALVTTGDNAWPFVAVQQIGLGKFVYSGDSNIFSDEIGGYAYADNGRFARNLCGDIDPPTVTIVTPPQGARYPKNAAVNANWFCTDTDSGVDPNPLKTFGTVAAGQPIDTTVPDGGSVTKTFRATCTDNLGNSTFQEHQYVVDDRPPAIAITVPNGGSHALGSVVPAEWTCTDPDNDVATATFTNESLSGSGSGTAIDTSTKGVKSYTVTCTDLVGNTATQTVHYTVPNSPPVASITSPVDGARFKAGAPVNAVWGCSDPDGPGDLVSQVATPALASGSPLDTTAPAGTTLTRTLSVACADADGATSPPKSVTYTVDDSSPTATITVPLDGGTYARGSSQPAAWTCTDDDGDADIKTKDATAPVGTSINTSTLGLKTFTLTCTDQVGNSATKTVSYTVFGGPPTVTITSPVDGKSYDQGAVIPPTYSCTDPDNDLKSCVREGGGGPIDTSKGGTFAFTVNAEDLAGNKATKTVHYTIKPKAVSAPATAVSPSTTKTTKVCTSRRQFRIRVKKLRGGVKAVSATVFVNGKKTLTRKGKRVTAIVTLKGLKKGQYKVKINVKYSNGRVLSYTRKFKTCTPKGK